MITEDYVSFETAKLLKEKGFNGVCRTAYETITNEHEVEQCSPSSWGELNQVKRPTHQTAMKWLRETHNIGIFPSLFAFSVGEGGAPKPTYGTKIISLKSCELLTDDTNPMPTYEEACEAAIRYTLENLI